MAETRTFSLGAILSVTTERFVAPEGIGALYDLLGYMTGESLFTHQLPRAGRTCAPALLAQHPQLADVTAEDVTPDNWRAWLDAQVAQFGAELPVAPLTGDAYVACDPFLELRAMVGSDKPIVAATLPRVDEVDHG